METNSNHVIVGTVAITLLIGLFAFIMWLAGFHANNGAAYDIFFKSGVSGLAKGSQVQYAGVPVGTVKEIRLLPKTPEFVRVRIMVDEDVAILQGTVASLESQGFTGVSLIQLSGATRNALPISDPGPYGAPVIPTKPGALGQLLNSAPQLMERLSTLSQRLNQLLDDRNQQNIAKILTHAERVSGAMADKSGDIGAAIADARQTLQNSARAAEAIAQTSEKMNVLVDEEGRPLLAQLRSSAQRADSALAAFEKMSAAATPGVTSFSNQTVPEINQLIVDLRAVSSAMASLTQKLENDPASALSGNSQLPDYPAEDK